MFSDNILNEIIYKHNKAARTNRLLRNIIKQDILDGKLMVMPDLSVVMWPTNWTYTKLKEPF